VIVELWPDNTVIVSESFDEATATRLRELVGRGAPALHALAVPAQELRTSFYQLPAFREFQAPLGEQFLRALQGSVPAARSRSHSRGQHDAKFCLAAHHACISLGRFFQGIGFDHGTHSGEFREAQCVLGVGRRS